ncbi:hypothetical protein [Streptomonospora litoralis]|uniref:Lipoprotein n=1 Tax=Streptomonospora litoralis TaxID=2498135 RepID=A0A4P6Q6D0_9ACTN|nr:hypothetical protein [Streptomonospora litoralis]QBI56233.1 hypothetical protein EKD16_22400 [Streptomonospora litoralis]
MPMKTRLAVALCAVAAGLCAAGCGVVDTGVRVSGAAPTPTEPAPRTEGGTPARSVDAVEVLREDPGVSDAVKEAVVRPCPEGYGEGWYPVYVRYYELPDTGIPVVLINVQGCAGSVACTGALGGYVYRLWEGRAERIYTTTGGASEVAWHEGGPVVERADWAAGSGAGGTCPESLTRTRLEWDGAGLTEQRGE